jgi:hypothetical protein
MTSLATPDDVERFIVIVRGQKVILDRDLATLYGVTTGNLNKAVSRNHSKADGPDTPPLATDRLSHEGITPVELPLASCRRSLRARTRCRGSDVGGGVSSDPMRPPVRVLVLLIAVLGLESPRDAGSAEMPTRDEQPPLIAAVRGDVGVGSAIGAIGASVVLRAARHVQFEIGTGLGGSGVQLSFMPKLTIGDIQDHFVFGAGVSVAFPWQATSATGHPVWLNVDAVGYEHMSRRGFAFLAAAGLTGGLGGGRACDFRHNAICDDATQLTNVSNVWAPQFRLGFGYAF